MRFQRQQEPHTKPFVLFFRIKVFELPHHSQGRFRSCAFFFALLRHHLRVSEGRRLWIVLLANQAFVLLDCLLRQRFAPQVAQRDKGVDRFVRRLLRHQVELCAELQPETDLGAKDRTRVSAQPKACAHYPMRNPGRKVSAKVCPWAPARS